jgi:deazaflavin-dependent oxidoreductase (nitroreductase family)
LPRWYLKLGNVTSPAMYRLLPVPRGFALLHLVGRKTGKPRPRPIRAIRDGGTLYGVAIGGKYSDWLKNARGNPAIRVKVGRRTRRATMREVTDADEAERATQIYVDTVVPYDYQDYPMVHWDWPSRRKIIDAHRRWVENGVLVAIDLEDIGGGTS